MQQFVQQSQILHLEHQVSALVTQDVFPIWLLNNKCSISPVSKAGTKYKRTTERRHHTIWAQTKYTGWQKCAQALICIFQTPPKVKGKNCWTLYIFLTYLLFLDTCHCQVVQHTSQQCYHSWWYSRLFNVLKTHSVQWSSAVTHWPWNTHTKPTPCFHPSVPVLWSGHCTILVDIIQDTNNSWWSEQHLHEVGRVTAKHIWLQAADWLYSQQPTKMP